MPRRVQEAMKTGAGEIRVAEAKGRGGQRGSGRKQEEREKRKQKGRKMVEVKRIAKEWEIQDEEEKIARSEEEAKKLVSEKFHQ